MKPYPKIETLFKRDPETFKVTDELRHPEFGLVSKWIITEKIDGTNVRVTFFPDGNMHFQGRTDNAQMPPFLLDRLNTMFNLGKVGHLTTIFEPFDSPVTLYGEGYGARIQKGGGDYREGVNFRLFDVRIGEWWLNWSDVEDVARKLGIKTVPVLWGMQQELGETIKSMVDEESTTAIDEGGKRQQEGIVARTEPLLFDRRGNRLMWKLKRRDY